MLPFSVVHVRFVSVECRILFSEVAYRCLRLAQICRAPVCCYDAISTFERKRLGPPCYVGDARTRFGGTVCLGQRFSVSLE